MILLFLAGLTAVMVVGQRLHAPDWLRERIEARIERGLGGVQIEFGDVNLIVHEGWRPRLRLRDVELRDPEGRVIARLADASASLAMRPLLRGRVLPKRISLNGAAVHLRRLSDGQMSLSFGGSDAPVDRAPSLAQLVDQADRILELPNFSALVAFRMDAVTLAYEDERQGRRWTLDGGFVQAGIDDGDLRIATGFSLLGGRDYASTVEANYDSRIGSSAARFGILIQDLPAEDIAAQSPALAWLQVLQAPISGALRGSIDGTGALEPVSATLQIGAGAVQPTAGARPIPFSGARTYFTLDPARQLLDFAEISVDSDWGSVVGDGQAYLNGVETGRLSGLEAQLRLAQVDINPDNLFPAPLALERAEVDFQLKLDPFRLRIGRATVWDEDRTLRLAGHLSAPPEGWQVAVDARMDRITPEALLGYWPGRLAQKPRDWVSQNLTAAQVEDLDLAVRLAPGGKPDIYADFDFHDATIRYAKILPPVTRAKGQANLLGRRFTVVAEAGEVVTDTGDVIDAAGTSFIIPDIGIRKAAPGLARIRGRGPVTGVLSLLDRPPLRVMSKANLPVDLATGQVEVAGTLALPLKQKVELDEMEFHFTGIIADVESDRLVPGHVVRAPLLQASGDQTSVRLTGSGRFGPVPMQIDWRQPIGKGPESRSRLDGTIELSPDLLEELNVGLPPGSVSGRGTASVVVEAGGGAPVRIEATSDLRGVALEIPALGWGKPASAAGQFDMVARPGPQGGIEAISLSAAGLRAEGAIDLAQGGGLERARFSRFSVGDWLSAPVELVGRGNAPPEIRVQGGTLDLRRAKFGARSAGGGGAERPPLAIALNRVQVTESLALTDFQGRIGGVGGSFAARLNGGTSVSGQLLSRPSGMAVFLQSEDAGGVFRSARILNQARGGQLRMSLEPTGQDGQYDGLLQVRNTRIQDAPAMAALLNAVSVVGLIDEMSGQGIQFSEIDGRFRIDPGRLTIHQGSAVGPSIGLSLDGVVDTARGVLDLRGVISPVYVLNAIGSVLTRKGEGMIGFTYRLTGPTKQPQVRVNPLSGLAPGFFREIFREPPPAEPAAPGEAPVRKPRPSILDQRPGEDR